MKNLKKLGQSLNKRELSSITGSGFCIGKNCRCQNQHCPVGYCCGSDPHNCVPAGPNNRNCR